MITPLKTFIAFFGYLLFCIVLYFSFFPMQVKAQSNFSVDSVVSCEKNPGTDILQQLNITDINNPNLPIDLSGSLNQYVNSISQYFGRKAAYKTSLCLVNNRREDIMKTFQDYFTANKKYYSYSSTQAVLAQLGKVPLVSIAASNYKYPASIVRTTYCNRPIFDTQIYLLTFKNQGDYSIISTVEIYFEKNTDSLLQNTASNLVSTGQWLKEKVNCNEK